MRVVKQFINGKGDPFITVYTDYIQSLVMDVWTGDFETPDRMTAAIAYSAAQLQTKKLSYWLSDVTHIEGDLGEAVDEAAEAFEVLLPVMELKKFAIVSPRPTSSPRTKLVDVLRRNGVEVKIFATYPAAIEWLVVPEVEEAIWDAQPVLNF